MRAVSVPLTATLSFALLVALLFALLATLPAVALAQPDAAMPTPPDAGDPLAYSPTGDALWDTFAQAVLAQLARFEEDPSVLASAGLLPEDVLDSWEPQFGADPRYWELRFWTVTAAPVVQPPDRQRAAAFLERALTLGVADANTTLLAYDERRHRLSAVEQQLQVYDAAAIDTAPLDWLAAPPAALTTAWFEEQEFALAHWQAQACPDEAWAQYNLARQQFAYGEWEDGLSALDAGNAAPRAVMPQPFPLSYYLDRTEAGLGVGSELVAGLLAGHATMWALPNFIILKGHLLEQQSRLALGADWRELAPWYGFSCRLGQMGRATAVQQLTGIVLLRLSLKPLLVDVPSELSAAQREAVLAQYTRTNKVKELIKYEMDQYQPDLDQPPALLISGNAYWATVLALQPGVADNPAPAQQLESAGATLAELAAALSWAAQCVRAEFQYTAPAVREQFAGYAQFDFATLALPE